MSAETVDLIHQAIDAITREIREAGDELAVAAMAQEIIERNVHSREHFDLIRTAAFRAALLVGFTYADVAAVTGLSRQRIQQIAELPPASPGRRPANLDRSSEAERVRRRDGPDGL